MKKKKDHRLQNGRDLHMVSLINGANKASVTPDRKKKLNKSRCRGKVRREEDQ